MLLQAAGRKERMDYRFDWSCKLRKIYGVTVVYLTRLLWQPSDSKHSEHSGLRCVLQPMNPWTHKPTNPYIHDSNVNQACIQSFSTACSSILDICHFKTSVAMDGHFNQNYYRYIYKGARKYLGTSLFTASRVLLQLEVYISVNDLLKRMVFDLNINISFLSSFFPY
jgi:hypothetical protein